MKNVNDITKEAKEALKAYNAARHGETDQERIEARETFKKIEATVNKESIIYKTLFSLIYAQIKAGNNYIDLAEPFIYSGYEAELIDAFRVYGIELFTFSSQWSNAGRSAYEFAKKGATVEDIIEVYTGQESFDGQKEKAPAYIFRVN